MRYLPLFILSFCLAACSTPGNAANPVNAQAAQNVGNDQGSAQATETVSSQTDIRPVIYNFIGFSSAKVNPEGGVEASGEGGGFNGTLTVQGATLGEGASSQAHSGGGAAGGTGNPERKE